MRTLAHVSDLHFGREEPTVVEGLLADLEAVKPDLVVISGDLTQRARRGQFEKARDFLRRLPAPALAIPGNHDVPLFDLPRRLLDPLGRYRRYVSQDVEPMHRDDEIAVLGLDSTRRYRVREGELSEAQAERLRERLQGLPAGLFKVLVVHHPFTPSPAEPDAKLVANGLALLRAAEECGVDLVLSGHLHHGHIADVRATYGGIRRGMLAAHAGTAVSSRRRLESNTYNRIAVEGARLTFEVRTWNGSAFAAREVRRFARQAGDWREAEQGSAYTPAP
jgi:3',5'-cyclic AMP phosphodiesterase CpdA